MDEAERADIQASLAGDGAAYARLIRRHQDSVALRIRRFARNRGEVEELAHDVFVEAYFSLRSFRGDAPLEHWLARIATRVGYRHWKRKARETKTASLRDDVAAPTPELSSDEDLQQVLAKLPPRDRLVVTLLYLEEKPVAEAAALTGWSKTMVKVQAFRARAKLRKLMENQHG